MLRCFYIGPSRSRRQEHDALEAVSETQISKTCLAAYVQDDTVWFAFADGRHARVDSELAQRSPLLRCALESSNGGIEYLRHRDRIFQWYECVVAMNEKLTEDAMTSTLTILRQLLAVDFMGDDDAVHHLAQRLGARLFPEGSLSRQSNSIRKPPPLHCREQVRTTLFAAALVLDELPKPLAWSVLQATPASLHQCLLHLPRCHHEDVLLARFPSILRDSSLALHGQESAKAVGHCSSQNSEDTISTALAASTAFPHLRQLQLNSMCLSKARVQALTAALEKLTSVTSIQLSNCLIDSDHITQLLSPAPGSDNAVSESIKRLTITSCLFRQPCRAAQALTQALPCMSELEQLDLTKLPFRDAFLVLPGVIQLAELGVLKSLRIPFALQASSTPTFWRSLSCCTGLSQLALTDAVLTQTHLANASNYIRSLTCLEVLELRVERLDNFACMPFYECLKELTAISKLRLAGHISAQSALGAIAEALGSLHNLRHFEISGHKQRNVCQLSNHFCSALHELTKLTFLHCKALQIPTDGHEDFENALAHLPDLAVLKMSNLANVAGSHFVDLYAARQLKHIQIAADIKWPTAASAVVASLQAVTELERLECLVDFTSDSLSASFIEGFGALTSLTRLRLKGGGIGTKGVKALAKAAQAGSFPKLLHLRLETVGVQACAVKELALGLPNLKGLLQMSLSFLKCKDRTVDSLLTHMTQFSVLTCLELMHARLPDASVLLLNHALSNMPTLARLSLSNAVIGTSGANLLTRTLPKLTGLSFLSLSACPIGDKGAGVLAEALKGLYRLRELHLNSTDMTDQGACALLGSLSHVFLTHVRFKSNPRMKGCPAVASGMLKEPWVVLS